MQCWRKWKYKSRAFRQIETNCRSGVQGRFFYFFFFLLSLPCFIEMNYDHGSSVNAIVESICSFFNVVTLSHFELHSPYYIFIYFTMEFLHWIFSIFQLICLFFECIFTNTYIYLDALDTFWVKPLSGLCLCRHENFLKFHLYRYTWIWKVCFQYSKRLLTYIPKLPPLLHVTWKRLRSQLVNWEWFSKDERKSFYNLPCVMHTINFKTMYTEIHDWSCRENLEEARYGSF